MAALEHIFGALAEPSRRRIVELVRGEPRTVGELAARTGLSQPSTSKHLKVLREAGLVRVRVDGRHRLYEPQLEALQQIEAWLAPWRCLWRTSLDRLEEALAEEPEPSQHTKESAEDE